MNPLTRPGSRRALMTLTLALVAALGTPVALAAFPEKPITLVVPYPPGGASDVLGRITARHLQMHLPGSTVLVENKAGAGTAVGAQAVASAPPDGHMLLISSNTTWTMNPALKPKLPYDPIRSFEAIGTLGAIPLMLIGHPSVAAQNVKELIALARSQPGKLNYASFGNGTSSHFAGEMFKTAASVDLVHVPFNGSAPAMQNLLGGQVPLSFDTSVASVPQAKAGRVKAFAVTTTRRLASLPDVPTMAESGLAGYDLSAWVTLVAPRGLSEPVRSTLTKALAAALATPAMQAELTKAGLEVAYEGPETYEPRVNRELPAMRALVQKAGITVD